jgi:hypothetical protein
VAYIELIDGKGGGAQLGALAHFRPLDANFGLGTNLRLDTNLRNR